MLFTIFYNHNPLQVSGEAARDGQNISNKPGKVLPDTGGALMWLQIIGAALALISIIMLTPKFFRSQAKKVKA